MSTQTFHSTWMVYDMYMTSKFRTGMIMIGFLIAILNISGAAAAFGSSECDYDDD